TRLPPPALLLPYTTLFRSALCRLFVALDAVGQAQRNEIGRMAVSLGLLGGMLRQIAGYQRIDAAADAEYQRTLAVLDQLVGKEGGAADDFGGRIEGMQHLQRIHDFLLYRVDACRQHIVLLQWHFRKACALALVGPGDDRTRSVRSRNVRRIS